MGIEDLGKQAADLAGKAGEFVSEHAEQITDALKSEQAEDISDKVLGGAADLANKVTGGKHADAVEDVRQKLDGAVGNE